MHATVVTYPDGVVTVRPLRPGDTAAVQAIFDRLGPRSRALRFGGAKTELSERELAELARVDGRRHALVAYADGAPIAIARLARDRDDPSTADLAYAVIDEWQGRGVGRMLVGKLVDDARAVGIAYLRASIRTDNVASLAIMRRVTKIVRSRHAFGQLELVGRAA